MSWYKVTLTGDMAKRHCWSFPQEVIEHFQEVIFDDTVPRPTANAFLYKQNECPEGACTYYFSPDAANSYKKIIGYYGGEPCFKPSPSDVSQSIGGKDATKFLSE